jgi:hypothetical protein
VGGDFSLADGLTDSSLAVWNGSAWNPIGSKGFNGDVLALTADGKGGVYAGGFFTEVSQITRNRLVHWTGSGYITVASGVDNEVEALATDNSALYAGGWFEQAGNTNTTSLHFGALDGAGADVTNTSYPRISLSVYPNPGRTSKVLLELPSAEYVHLYLENSLGIRVATIADGIHSAGQVEFPFPKNLAAGPYFVKLSSETGVVVKPVIVQ